jgi:hypothetical protein
MVTTPDLVNELTREWVERVARGGQQAFRTRLRAVADVCEITGEGAFEALDAAHIVDASSGGVTEVRNGLLLRADLHRLYDGGLLRISVAGKVTIDETLRDSGYWAYNGLQLPPRTVARVSEALRFAQSR